MSPFPLATISKEDLPAMTEQSLDAAAIEALQTAIDMSGAKSRIAKLTSELTDVLLKPYLGTASCHEGCNACCRQSSIMIDEAEAMLIEQELHIARRVIPTERTDWKGVPCRFLNSASGRCDIYAFRPQSCRASLSFDDPAKCESEVERQMITFASVVDAVVSKIGRHRAQRLAELRGPHSADIRDFFCP